MQSVQKLLGGRRFSFAKVLAALAVSTIGATFASASVVISGSSFDISVIGFTGSGGTGNSATVVGPISGTFGGTNNYSGVAMGGQVTTVTSSETVVGSQTIDTITISVPTNFVSPGFNIGGQPITGLFFDLGEAVEATNGPTTQNGLQLSFALNPAYQSATGTAQTTSTGVVTIIPPPTSSFNGTDTMLYAYEGVQRLGGGDISPIGVTSFTYVSVVPEPLSGGVLALVTGFGLLRRRRV